MSYLLWCCRRRRRETGEDDDAAATVGKKDACGNSAATLDVTSENGETEDSRHICEGDSRRKSGVRPGPKPTKGANQGGVLVELFTSQGCSSCPPADWLISRLGRGEGEDVNMENPKQMVVLAYHVNYWDYLGWKDPFSSDAWTLKQRAYGNALGQDRIFTPEIVIQGRIHSVASNGQAIVSLIQAAPQFPPPNVETKITRPSPLFLQIALRISLKYKVEHYTIDVMLALHESRLVTECNKGENRGKALKNDFVVRGVHKVCSLQDLPARKMTRGEVTFSLWEGFSTSNCGLALILQNPDSMEVYAAQHLELPADL
ncbi:hypothetical protein R1sor_022357 [Riccia sorocarpa]|uniref:DUF1223 domain-containing protein n=1 Tax=Riccia sorocarpa TaxID=122646 RepID=A0ABD3GL48_9MARC